MTSKSKDTVSSTLIPLIGVVATATATSLYYLLLLHRKSRNNKKHLGPETSPETRYELTLRGRTDTIYQKERMGPKPFEFNRDVTNVFDDMISRSVPLYCEVIDLALYWVQRYYQPGTTIYDLGCSTGTTIDILARFFSHQKKLLSETQAITSSNNNNGDTETKVNSTCDSCHFVGVDNSKAMVQACHEKLEWAKAEHKVDIYCSDILDCKPQNSSFTIMNYTLQFIPVVQRQQMLKDIYEGLCDGGIFFLSEKVRAECSEIHETCVWIYEDFKLRRQYTKREIARKKEALMNVLIPYTEAELRNVLVSAGFENVYVIAKWNNFLTMVARKGRRSPSLQNNMNTKRGRKKKHDKVKPMRVTTPNMDKLFDSCPTYVSDLIGDDQNLLHSFCVKRLETFSEKGVMGNDTLTKFDEIASMILSIPAMTSKRLIVNEPVLSIGDKDELNEQQQQTVAMLLEKLRPWKKGPLNLFGTNIDTEWRSDWKWERLQEALPDLKDKVVCDLGCGNGYYMYRMLQYEPRLVVGIDPNLHAFLEFKMFQRFSGVENIQFEYLRGDSIIMFPNVFDVVFCLGVLYHTNDPIGMLRDIHKSMKGGSTLIVDCQGIPGDEDIALFPQKRYVNMKGVYFLPTISTLKNWLRRAQFTDFTVIFSQVLSTEEQRITEWAPVNTSLKESLDPSDEGKTIEGYPAPHRFYVKVRK